MIRLLRNTSGVSGRRALVGFFCSGALLGGICVHGIIGCQQRGDTVTEVPTGVETGAATAGPSDVPTLEPRQASRRAFNFDSVKAGVGLFKLKAAGGVEAAQTLRDGDFLFLPNRRTIWVVERQTGRFANFDFRKDHEKTVKRTAVETLDLLKFPPTDTIFLVSDPNYSQHLWVCNTHTGIIQLWVPKADGTLDNDGEIEAGSSLLLPR